jgi:COMPASS component SWD3
VSSTNHSEDVPTAELLPFYPAQGTCVRTFTKHTSHVTCLAFNPKSNVLATGSWDERVILWDIKQGSVLRELPAHSDPLTAVGFNVDGTMLVSSSFDGLM